MDFKFQAVTMIVLSTNIVMLIIYLIMRSQKVFPKFGYQILGMFLVLTGIRMLFPFEFTAVSHNINYPESISRYLTAYVHEGFFNETVSMWNISEIIWLAGSLVCLGKYLKRKHKLEKYISRYGKEVKESSECGRIFQEIRKENKRTENIQLLTLPQIGVPMVYGMRKPRVLLPETLHLEKEELSFVIRHELSHFLHHDLYIKWGIQMLCIVYWWNPLSYFLKKQADVLLEMHVDSKVADSQKDKEIYMQCILNVARNMEETRIPDTAIAFCSKNTTLKSRFHVLMLHSRTKQNRILKTCLLLSIIVLYINSFVFILEPDYVDFEKFEANGWVIPTRENSYLIDNKDGTYDFYLEGEFVCKTKSTRYYLDGTAIYRYDEEGIVYEK